MGGIAGFVGSWPAPLLTGMVAALGHRGPDDAGTLRDEPTGMALGHTRLAVIDPGEASSQPMMSADGRFAISFDGEIYNYRALRRELEEKGARFRSQGDTEVLLELFARDGASCLMRLEGIFAVAVWDGRLRRLFLARDHLGVKPLYYAALPKGFLFASELKALTLCPDLPRDLDAEAVAAHLGFLWNGGEGTMLRAAKKLRPGCLMLVDESGVRIERWYRAPLAVRNPEPEAAAPEALRDLIDVVVAEQMVADVEIGALLSGGVDSSAVVAAMARATETARITTFCAAASKDSSAADNFGDDPRYARDVAAALGVRLIEVPIEPDLIDGLSGMVWQLDEPTADFAALQTALLAHAAHEHGIKVLMTDTGGDDLFIGYDRHRAALIYDALDHMPAARGTLGTLARLARPGTVAGRRLARLGALLAMDEETMLAEAMSFSAVTGAARLALLAPDRRADLPPDGIPAPIAESLARSGPLHPVERLIDLELNFFLPDHELNCADKMAMREGVEIRVPLCDPRLVAFAQRLPLDARIDRRRTKKILRESQRGRLPDDVLRRPKQGFGMPMRGWLRGPARPLLAELTAKPVIAARGLFDADAAARLRGDFLAGRADTAMTLFALMAIELWCRALDAAPRLSAAR